MKSLIYAIGDVHGKYDLFEKLIHYYDPTIHQLVLLGDLNDRGPRTKECFLLGKQLVEETGAIYLRGNHEEYFCNFCKRRRTGMRLISEMVEKKHLKAYFTQVRRRNTPRLKSQ